MCRFFIAALGFEQNDRIAKTLTCRLDIPAEQRRVLAEMGAVQHTLHNMATDFSQLAAVVQRLIDVTGLDQPPPPPPHNADSLPEGESRMAWAYSVVGEQDRSKIEGDLTTLASDGPAAGRTGELWFS